MASRISDLRTNRKPAGAIEALEAQRLHLIADAMAADTAAKEAQAAGDAIYWPIFDVDRKNPSVKPDVSHLPPREILANLLEKDRQVTEILGRLAKVLEFTT